MFPEEVTGETSSTEDTDSDSGDGSCNYDITDVLLDATTLINGAQTNFTYEVSLDEPLEEEY